MQGSGSRDDDGAYATTMNGPLDVIALSITVGGGKDDGFTIGQGAILTATGASTTHQGFIEGSGTLDNGTPSNFSSAVMDFVSSATVDAVTFGGSSLNNDTSIGVFMNYGVAEFGGFPMPGEDDDFSAGTIVNDGTFEFLAGSASVGLEQPTDITGTGDIVIPSGATAVLGNVALSGLGNVEIQNGATAVLANDATVGTGQTFVFDPGTLVLRDDPGPRRRRHANVERRAGPEWRKLHQLPVRRAGSGMLPGGHVDSHTVRRDAGGTACTGRAGVDAAR